MKDFQGKTAVVTGAASGIGRALAEKCIQEGMKVVLADVEESALNRAADELKDLGGEVLAVRTDVSSAEQVEALAQQAFATYGGVHLLFNNAGVGAGTSVWDSSLADWQWVLGVNLWGIIHGIHYFVPRMLAQNEQGYIVNTASSEGVVAHAGLGVYRTSKHAAVSLTETLALELAERGANIKASVLCPEWVNTRILESERNRPDTLQNTSELQITPEMLAALQTLYQDIQKGLPPAQVANIVFDAIREEKFYIFTHLTTKLGAQVRMEDLINERQPRDITKLAAYGQNQTDVS
jgi:NAD(P)-dependent dehydrogenase (short-subunit alcohol dehydrogenase family)